MSSVYLASASESIKVWEVTNATDIKLKSFCGSISSDTLSSISWNHTNQVLAVGGGSTKISLVQAINGQILSNVPFTDVPAMDQIIYSQPIRSVTFSHNSRYLSMGVAASVHLWDLKKRQQKLAMPDVKGDITSVLFLPEGGGGGDMISGDRFGSVHCWDIKRKLSIGEMTFEDRNAVQSIALAPTGTLKVASAHISGAVCILDPSNFVITQSMKVHRASVTGVAFSPKNARLIATSSLDGKMLLVDTATKSSEPSAAIDVGDRLHCIAFHEDAIHTAVGTNSGHILLYDWRHLRQPVCKIDVHAPNPVYALSFQNLVPTPANKAAPVVVQSTANNNNNNNNNNHNHNHNHNHNNIKQPIASTSSMTAGQRELKPTVVTKSILKQDSEPANLPLSVIQIVDKPFPPAPPLALQVTLASRDPKLGTASDLSCNTDVSSKLVHQFNSVAGISSVNTSMSSISLLEGDASIAGDVSVSSVNSRHQVTVAMKQPPTASVNAAASVTSNISSKHLPNTSTGTSSNHKAQIADDNPIINNKNNNNNNNNNNNHRIVSDQQRRDSHQSPSNQKQGRAVEAATSASSVVVVPVPAAVTSSARQMDSTRHVSTDEFGDLKNAVRPVTIQDLQDEMKLLKYDIHKEVQTIIKEQLRHFDNAKEDQSMMIQNLEGLLKNLLHENQALRKENEQLRKMY